MVGRLRRVCQEMGGFDQGLLGGHGSDKSMEEDERR